MNTSQKKIGAFIKSIRERKGLTQKQFAKALNTSQSAVARMEKGGQNFSTELLNKIGGILGQNIVSINQSMDFVVEGGKKLKGKIATNFSKNGSVGLLCASLLNQRTTTLHGISRIEEVYRVIEILESIGVNIKWIDDHSIKITPPKRFKIKNINKASAIKTRSIIMCIGPLVHILPSFSIPHASGCRLGKRTISAHTKALEELGIKIKTTNDSYDVTAKKLKAKEIVMYESGDTACENILMAASKVEGKTTIKNVSANYMVQEVSYFLRKLGVKIEGIGTNTITIEGKPEINTDIEYSNSEDPIESMMYISAAILTDSELTIERCPIDFLTLELYRLKSMGQKYKILKKYKSYNGTTNLIDLKIIPSTLKAPEDKIHANPYPGINIDNLPFFIAISLKAKGTTLVHDWFYENRAVYAMELNRLGANVTLADPHRVYITGGNLLKPAQVVCPPALRPSVIILVAMLAAKGTSILRNVYMINRGYEDIVKRLTSIGANIKIIQEV